MTIHSPSKTLASTHSHYCILASIRNWLFVLASKFQNASTHSQLWVLASTENWLCVLEESMNISTHLKFKI